MFSPSITMIRETLEDIPRHEIPQPFSIRWYEPGDIASWLNIHRAADDYNEITPQLYEDAFGGDDHELSRRQCFLVDGHGHDIGTGTAWYGDLDGDILGRVHWIAIRPQLQGVGLSKPLLAAVCARMKSLGHTRAYLTTRPIRRAAISLYRSFGFHPYIRKEADVSVWRGLGWSDL